MQQIKFCLDQSHIYVIAKGQIMLKRDFFTICENRWHGPYPITSFDFTGEAMIVKSTAK